ncbi:PAS fold sensor protein [Croceitalea dokdonensis DOKDO 023]|uniref:PAS fold sensor protein n=2 Tax=Croceitalea TaxID=574891 RepID=A0A0P7AHK7_9FLAO|nr:PAS fold sensor protein [Croceitalea dokdonensis DOKDO 023]
MEEMKHYDKAANKFYANLNITELPLAGWDVFSKFFSKVCESLQDINILKGISHEQAWQTVVPFEKEVLKKKHIIVVTDAKLNIVHATQNIYDMNGYRPEEIVGQKPKIFQGEKTCKHTAQRISKAVRELESFEATILNYRKDGSTYNCWIKGTPIYNRKGKVVNFIAFEREVA